jgi:large subunit ribosomal protein L32e
MTTKKFIRRNWTKASRLGRKRKSKQVWRAAKGRHNKIREKRKGYPIKVMVGFRKKENERDLIKDKKPVIVRNLAELGKIKNTEIAIIGKVGNKKRIEMIKKAKEEGIHVYNINVNKMLKKIEKKKKNSPKKEAKEKKNEHEAHSAGREKSSQENKK